MEWCIFFGLSSIAKGVINVFSTERTSLTTKYLQQQRNINSYDTFFTKCVVQHLVKEMSGGA